MKESDIAKLLTAVRDKIQSPECRAPVQIGIGRDAIKTLRTMKKFKKLKYARCFGELEKCGVVMGEMEANGIALIYDPK